MFSHNNISHHTTQDGETFIIVPAPRFDGCTIDSKGKPVAVKYPRYNCITQEDWYQLYPDLKGLNLEDVEKYKPAFIIYKLGDGTLLLADKAAISKAGEDYNSAAHNDLKCLLHLVKDLEVVEMPKVRKVTTK